MMVSIIRQHLSQFVDAQRAWERSKHSAAFYTVIICLALLAAIRLPGQTMVDLKRQARDVDFSNAQTTKPVRTGTTLPSTCGVGEMFFNTSPGGGVYSCAAANTWTPVGGGGPTGLADPGGNGILARTGFDTTAVVGTAATPLTAQNIEQVFYADQFANIQAAVTAAGTSGVVVIPRTYPGTDTWTNPNGIRLVDERTAANQKYNVRAWGCKGDGVHDDTACLTNFFAWLNTQTEGTAYFRAGKYLMNGTLYSRASNLFVGDGLQASFLVETAPTADLLVISGNTWTTTQWGSGTYITNMSFAGEGKLTTGNLVLVKNLTIFHNVGFFGTGGRGVMLMSERTWADQIFVSDVRQAWVTADNIAINESYLEHFQILSPGIAQDDLNITGSYQNCSYNINAINCAFPAGGAVQGDPHETIQWSGGVANVHIGQGSIKPTSQGIGGIKFRAAQSGRIENMYIENFNNPGMQQSIVYGGNHEKLITTAALSGAQLTVPVDSYPKAGAGCLWMTPYVGNSADLPVEGVNQITLPYYVIRPPDYVNGSTTPSSIGGSITQGTYEYVKWQGCAHASTDTASFSGAATYGGSTGRGMNGTAAMAWPAGAIVEEAWGDPRLPGTIGASPLDVANVHAFAFAGAASPWSETCSNTNEQACGEMVVGFEPDAYYKAGGNYPTNPHWYMKFGGSTQLQTASDPGVGRVQTFGPAGIDCNSMTPGTTGGAQEPSAWSNNTSISAACIGGSTFTREQFGSFTGDLVYSDSQPSIWHLWGPNQFQGFSASAYMAGLGSAGVYAGNNGYAISHNGVASNNDPRAYTMFDWQGIRDYSGDGTNENLVFNLSYPGATTGRLYTSSFQSGVNTVAYSATPTFDLSLGDQTITLTGNVTSSAVTNLVPGQKVSFRICQDVTGGRTFAWPVNVRGAMTIGAASGACSAQQFESFDGSTMNAIAAGVANQ